MRAWRRSSNNGRPGTVGLAPLPLDFLWEPTEQALYVGFNQPIRPRSDLVTINAFEVRSGGYRFRPSGLLHLQVLPGNQIRVELDRLEETSGESCDYNGTTGLLQGLSGIWVPGWTDQPIVPP